MTRFDRDWLLSGLTLWLLVGVVALVLTFIGTALQLVTGGIDAGGIVNLLGKVTVGLGVVLGTVAFVVLLWRLG